MLNFKYTVANQEGKKLSGIVEAPDEKTARGELNNLGFSILAIAETKETPQTRNNQTKFVFEAIDKNSKLVTGTIPGETSQEAFNKLQTQYNLNVTAIWRLGIDQKAVDFARREGTEKFLEQLKLLENDKEQDGEKGLEDEKQKAFLKGKIEQILANVNQLLKKFDKEIDANQKSEINKKIDKLLRIKHSTNLDYILASAQELLSYIQEQEKTLQEKGFGEKRFEFKIETKKLLDELNSQAHEKTFVESIEDVEKKYKKDHNMIKKIFLKLLDKLKSLFEKPQEVIALEEKITSYNDQIWEFIKLYFKEPTPEYKEKVKLSIKSVWQMRKKTVEALKTLKIKLKKKKKIEKNEENLFIIFLKELNSFSGWLLAFYITYYFAGIYLNTKNFGLNVIPEGFKIYESQIFKYTLVIIFLMHAATAVKINFFKKSFLADCILLIFFAFGTIITLLNF